MLTDLRYAMGQMVRVREYVQGRDSRAYDAACRSIDALERCIERADSQGEETADFTDAEIAMIRRFESLPVCELFEEHDFSAAMGKFGESGLIW